MNFICYIGLKFEFSCRWVEEEEKNEERKGKILLLSVQPQNEKTHF